jgi:hypothetical protein
MENIVIFVGFLGSHSGGYGEFYLLGYNAIYSVSEDISPPSAGSKNKPSKK